MILWQWYSHIFSMRATYDMNKSTWSAYGKNPKHMFINEYVENPFSNVCWCTLHDLISPHCTTQLTMQIFCQKRTLL